MKKYESLLKEGLEIGLASTSPALDGQILTLKELQAMANTSNYKNNKPYISKGHDGFYNGGGEPAYGYFDPQSLNVRDNTLYATPEYVNPELIQDIEDGKYHKLSIEYSYINSSGKPLYDENSRKLSDIEVLKRWIYLKQNIFYDENQKEVNVRDIFKPFLNGVAVLGRSTPAYPEFNISKKRTLDNFANNFCQYVPNDIIKTKEVTKFMSVKQEDVIDTQNNENIIEDTKLQDDKLKSERNAEAIKIDTNKNDNKSQNKFDSNILRDAYDEQQEVFLREIEKLKNDNDFLQGKITKLDSDITNLRTQLKEEKLEKDKYRMFSLWEIYKKDGRLRKEELVSNNFDYSKKLAEITQESDPIQRAILKRNIDIEAICSGYFFKDFHNSSEEGKLSMIRTIERKNKILLDPYKNLSTQNDNTINAIGQNEEQEKDYLYRRSREIAKAKGVDINSPDFDIEFFRSIARKEYENKHIGGNF